MWKPVCDILEAAGHKTHAPSVIGYGERAYLVRPDLHLLDHVQDLVEFVVAEALSDVVLVGHSYGGMVITGAAEQLAERIRHLGGGELHRCTRAARRRLRAQHLPGLAAGRNSRRGEEVARHLGSVPK